MKHNTIFYKGAIPASYCSEWMTTIEDNTEMGAHNIFWGQVRTDVIDDLKVVALHYDAQEEMVEREYRAILSELHELFTVQNVQVKHSLGMVKSGKLCLFIFLSSAHRSECQKAMDWLIEAIKSRLPIFAKEILENEDYVWKVNTAKAD